MTFGFHAYLDVSRESLDERGLRGKAVRGEAWLKEARDPVLHTRRSFALLANGRPAPFPSTHVVTSPHASKHKKGQGVEKTFSAGFPIKETFNLLPSPSSFSFSLDTPLNPNQRTHQKNLPPSHRNQKSNP